MAKVSKGAKARNKQVAQRNIRFEAAQLLGKWASLARGHVVMSGNCSCGVGGASVRVEEFEEQILDYLHTKFGGSGNAAVARALRGGSVSALLRSITADAEHPSAVWLPVLDALNGTIESFEQAHRGASPPG